MTKRLLLKSSKNIVIFIILLLFYILLSPQESLKYEVSVDAMLVPLFAVDYAGNPVHDLKQEEVELYVNGNQVKINYFNRYLFESDKEKFHFDRKDEKEPVPKPPDRVLFIIIDKVFNSLSGLKRSKKIASNLIKEGGKGDRFIVLMLTHGKGLITIGGSESTPEDLVKKIYNIKVSSLLRMKDSQYYQNGPRYQGGSSIRSLIKSSKMGNIAYQGTIKRFSHILSQLKYALKTIVRPKIVLLISEGVSRSAFVDPSNTSQPFNLYLFNYLKDIVKSVNQGGCVLYTINPHKISKAIDQNNSGEMSLRYMASESGGKYFAGSDTEKIIKSIKRTTAAYYELGFTVTRELGEQLELTVRCSRKGVRLHTLNHSERNRPYNQMEPVQKKLFAFNAVTGGSWSRMVGKINKIKFRKKGMGKNKYKVYIELPEKMRNCELDIFLINTDPKHDNADIDLKSKKSQEKLELDINRLNNKYQYFIIIEPGIPSCIYNKIF
jgi:VWFA-related protein